MIESLAGPAKPIISRLVDRFFPHQADVNRRKILNDMLKDERFPNGRSFKRLMRATGMTPDECRRLLAEVGAKGVTLKDGSEGWRLSRELP